MSTVVNPWEEWTLGDTPGSAVQRETFYHSHYNFLANNEFSSFGGPWSFVYFSFQFCFLKTGSHVV